MTEEKILSINILLIIVGLIFLVSAVGGWKQGLIDGVIGLVSFVIGLAVLALVASGIQDYLHKSYVKVTIAVGLIAVIFSIYRVVKFVLGTFKLLRFIPIGKFADKLAGIVLGLAEGLFVVWIAFFILDNITIMNINGWVFEQVAGNDILTRLYDANVIESIVIYFTSNIPKIQLYNAS
jgi:uncharacterized membrane protein required for colicin V production